MSVRLVRDHVPDLQRQVAVLLLLLRPPAYQARQEHPQETRTPAPQGSGSGREGEPSERPRNTTEALA
jgi:hypothetical protein